MGPIEIPACKSIEDYYDFLEDKTGIILNSSKRMRLILDRISAIEKDTWAGKYKVIIDEDLLAEVVNLVETPNVLVGHFPGTIFISAKRNIGKSHPAPPSVILQ